MMQEEKAVFLAPVTADSSAEDADVCRTNATRKRTLHYVVGALAAVGLVFLGVVAANLEGCDDSAGVHETMNGACKIPDQWCNTSDTREDKLSYRDCDGDGVLDPYCEGGELLRFGYISSAEGCKDTWPNGLCERQVEPDSSQGQFGDKAATNEITIIHFNDVYELGGVLEKGTRRGGFSRAANYLNAERKRNPDRTLAVFAGDALSPSVLSDLFKGAQMVDLLNEINLDAASLGNHEFDSGVDNFLTRSNESKFPWLNVNLFNESNQLLEGTSKYLIKELKFSPRWEPDLEKTVKVCFFGVAYDVRETMFKDTERIVYKDALETSKEEVKYLKETENCSVIIPMTHQFSAEDCTLSKALGEDVDVILGAHDHSTEFTSVCGHAPYLKAASNLKTQWVITLWLDDDGHVESVDGRLLSLTDADPFDNDIHAKVVEWEEKGAVEMGKKCGCSKTDLDAVDAHSRTQLTTGGMFFTDAVRSFHKTDVAMINGGTIRGDKVFQAGDLTKAILTQMHPYGNAIVKIYATGKQLHDYINENLNCWEEVCGKFVQVSGLKYTFNPDAPAGQRLKSLTLADDTPINETKKYTVALSDYMLANSKMNKNKLYNMVTTNDAVPIVMALFEAAEVAGENCIDVALDGRIKQV